MLYLNIKSLSLSLSRSWSVCLSISLFLSLYLLFSFTSHCLSLFLSLYLLSFIIFFCLNFYLSVSLSLQKATPFLLINLQDEITCIQFVLISNKPTELNRFSIEHYSNKTISTSLSKPFKISLLLVSVIHIVITYFTTN